MDISGIAAVVTGGASGLGEATARALAAAGAKVTIFDLNEVAGNAIANEIGGAFAKVDVTSDESVDAGFALARAAHGQERVLVNCAGALAAAKTAGRDRKTGDVVHFPLDTFERVVRINLVGTFRCVAKSAAGMIGIDRLANGERGVIINTASIAAEDGQMGQAAYAASKGGVVSLTLPVARDLAAEGIRVNAILPGVFETAMMQGAPENVREALAAQIPCPSRFGDPAEYADFVLGMIRSSYLNGEDIRLDGAVRMGAR